MKTKCLLCAVLLTLLPVLSIKSAYAIRTIKQSSLDSQDRTQELQVDGSTRTFDLFVPRRSAAEPLPLVIMLHGGGGTARAAEWETAWAAKAEKEGFYVAFPNAMNRYPQKRSNFAANPQLWNDGSERFYPNQSHVDDVAFIRALIESLTKNYNIDPNQIFLTGFSNGASMCFLAGAKLNTLVAAVAPVAGACWIEPGQLQPPVSLCYITGTCDPLNKIEGGEATLANGKSDKVRAKAKPPVRDSIGKWLTACHLKQSPAHESLVDGVHKQLFGPDENGTEVIYITVADTGHTWPGGRSLLPESMVGKTSNRLNATDEIWEFFHRHGRKSPN